MKAFSGLRHWLRSLLVVCALGYPLVLFALAVGFYVIGENWWLTGAGLYAPRVIFATPLPFAVLILWFTRLRRLLWTQLVAAIILAFPLFGFVLPSASTARAGAPNLRVLSFNVNSAFAGADAIAQKIFAESPDIVLLQEAPWGRALNDALRTRFQYVESSTQFIIASRYRITSSTDPARLPFFGRLRSPRFMRWVVETPLGAITIYSVHPISPRGVLHLHQFRAALHEIRTGELFAGDPEADVRSNAALREFQLQTAADMARRESLPVIIAGDTNLPTLSVVFRKHLSGFVDAFRSASWGLGYTYPDRHPFLRLDRILTSDKLRAVSFRVDCQGFSDHLCVVADIQASP
jgi:endonuclease/exonuclease/phosphatase family metal-dependent hydrolase